ncbi:hypothetical protein M9Y10_030984 [Tritrichomonas musculus]|uniref:Surface antigen BspA-like n=1 Tax=Tritrichomonas musculus TaxID=1915356 RepID=A0ABR2H2I4_9EUKA
MTCNQSISKEAEFMQVEKDNLVFELNNQKKTAIVIGNHFSSSEAFIPRSVTFNSQEFIVTSLGGKAFVHSSIETLRFPPDSELKTIEKDALEWTLIKSLTIPSGLSELKDGWCEGMLFLTNVDISEENKHFKTIDDKLIVGKSDEKSDEYDVIIFAKRDIKEATIPPNIRRISPYAFAYSLIESIFIPSNVIEIGKGAFSCCDNLQHAEISPDSKLQIIETDAFACSPIESIFIPPLVTQISNGSFLCCEKLRHVEIPPDSRLEKIEKDAFVWSMVENLFFPSSLSELEDGWCKGTKNLTDITISPDNKCFKFFEDKMIFGQTDENSDDYDVVIFAKRDIKNATIPPNIKKISSFSFAQSKIESIFISPQVIEICESSFTGCASLKHVEIPSNSELQKIGKNSFSYTSIESIYIPSNIKTISENSFSGCKELRNIEMAADSNLQIIEKYSFSGSQIESLTIPSNVSVLEEGWCQGTPNLENVTVDRSNKYFKNCETNDKLIIGKSDDKNDEYDTLVFVSRNIERGSIPSSIKRISPYAFSKCKIHNIFIPANVTEICEGAFFYCINLRQVEIPQNSKLQKIGKDAFYHTAIGSIYIPSTIISIKNGVFDDCYNLKIIEIDKKVNVRSIVKKQLKHVKNVTIMFKRK